MPALLRALVSEGPPAFLRFRSSSSRARFFFWGGFRIVLEYRVQEGFSVFMGISGFLPKVTFA